MVQTDRSTIFVIGGRQDYYVSNQVWIVNPEKEFQIIQSENLKIAREGSCCGKMIINGTMIVVVAGGWGEDSVEILINPRANKIWQFGNFVFSQIYSLVVIYLHKYFFFYRTKITNATSWSINGNFSQWPRSYTGWRF